MIYFEQEIAVALEKQILLQATSKKFFSSSLNNQIYVVGRNDQSLEYARRHKVSGIIDDFYEASVRWCGLPILRSRDISKDATIVNCVSAISPILVKKNLQSAGFTRIIDLASLISENAEILSLPWFVSQQRIELNQYSRWWSGLYSMLSDDISRKTLLDVMRFRLTADTEYMSNYEVRLRDQYFEEFMEYNEEVFVDAGGYDGDTTAEFIVRHPNYKQIYLFEPSRKNMDAAKRRLQGSRDIDFKFVGISDSPGTLCFDADSGSASAVKDGVGEPIPVVTLDEELRGEAISLIKMDLEGWELNALRGSEQIIRKNKPKLAIAVYHAARDPRQIAQYILTLNSNYKIYLRHYTQGWSEMIMYFK